MNDRKQVNLNRVDKVKGFKPFKSLEPVIQVDLRETECPLNFVKTKLALEKLKPGDILEIWVCGAETTSSLIRSITSEGHNILAQKQGEAFTVIKIEKGDHGTF
jgi:TusA-related sulfurtransferase